MKTVLNNFNAGELGRHLRCRIDLQKYGSGCELLENFTVLPWGGVEKSPGSRFVAECKYADKNTRLIPFEFNVEQSYAIEAGHGYFRFYADHVQISKDGAVYEVASPYDHETISQLRYTQSADVLYLIHPDYPPAKLCRYGHNDWQYKVIEFTGGPFKDENTEDITVEASGVTGNITLTASDDIFESGMVGSLFQILHPRENCSVAHMFTGDGVSPETIEIKGQWKVETTGSWNGTLVIERSFDNGTTWQNLRTWTSNQDRNIDDEGYENEENVLFRLKMTNWSNPDAQTLECKTTLSVNDYWVKGIVEITAVNSATGVNATVIEQIANTEATRDWAFGSWNDYSGYPRTVCFYQDRLCFASTAKQPQTVWMSCTGDYENFRISTLADAAMNYTIKGANGIQWMLPKRHIAVGTRVSEGLLKPKDEAEPFTSENREFSPETQCGSHGIDAIQVNDAVLFVQRGAEKLRELAYNFESDGYRAPDMSMLAPHILESRCTEMCYQQLPNSILWTVRNDGQLPGFTYERSENVTAWFRRVTAGQYCSAAVVADESTDELWTVVRRTVNGQQKQFIEYFENNRSKAQEDLFFVDCGLTYDGAASTEISGLDHLEGETVAILADGAVCPEQAVSGGKINLPYPASKVHAGLPYQSKLKPMPVELSGNDGVSIGSKKKINKIILKLLDSHGGAAGYSLDDLLPIHYRTAADKLDTAPELFSGDKEICNNSGHKKEVAPLIVHSEPLPFTVLAMIIEIMVS